MFHYEFFQLSLEPHSFRPFFLHASSLVRSKIMTHGCSRYIVTHGPTYLPGKLPRLGPTKEE